MGNLHIYDDPSWSRKYNELDRQVHGLEGAPEWNALRTMLPDIQGANILDLGCGCGWVCRWAREKGAAKVLGIDLSESMLAKAAEFPDDPAITYARRNMEEDLQLPAAEFDVEFSSLALHYLVNLPGLFDQVYRSLKPGGVFVFDVIHPIRLATENPSWAEGVHRNEWPVDAYLVEGQRSLKWLGGNVQLQHRTIAGYLMLLIGAGFMLAAIEEWGADENQSKAFPYWIESGHCPVFVHFKVVKPKS
jgi:SAM-dependent methyltransferase